MSFPEAVASFEAWFSQEGLALISAFAFDTALGVMLTLCFGAIAVRFLMILVLPNSVAGPGGAIFDTERGRGALDFFVVERQSDQRQTEH